MHKESMGELQQLAINEASLDVPVIDLFDNHPDLDGKSRLSLQLH